jgi:hypothetical protein
MPYVKNGKLYFISFALTSQAGPLKHGFEFDLSDRYNPKILGKYIGDKTDYVNLEVPVFVAGFAESKKINITHIFFDLVSANKWAETVKTAQ